MAKKYKKGDRAFIRKGDNLQSVNVIKRFTAPNKRVFYRVKVFVSPTDRTRDYITDVPVKIMSKKPHK